MSDEKKEGEVIIEKIRNDKNLFEYVRMRIVAIIVLSVIAMVYIIINVCNRYVSTNNLENVILDVFIFIVCLIDLIEGIMELRKIKKSE